MYIFLKVLNFTFILPLPMLNIVTLFKCVWCAHVCLYVSVCCAYGGQRGALVILTNYSLLYCLKTGPLPEPEAWPTAASHSYPPVSALHGSRVTVMYTMPIFLQDLLNCSTSNGIFVSGMMGCLWLSFQHVHLQPRK